jgi:D-amino peptidase
MPPGFPSPSQSEEPFRATRSERERERRESVRVFIISDMEGVAGITRWEQATGGESLYEEGRKLYTEEINAAVRGAASAGAQEIVVMDCHGAGKGWTFNSLLPEALDERCEFVVQNQWTEYTDSLESGCDAALFIGMHSRAGTPDGVLSHTVSGTEWRNLRFNGTLVGETGINAALCGHWGTPVVLVTGDSATCAEAKELLGPELTTAEVKRGFGRFSARHLAPVRARALIESAAAKALQDVSAVKPYDPGKPCSIEVELSLPDRAAEYRHRRGIAITDSRTVVSTGDDWWAAWRQLYF